MRLTVTLVAALATLALTVDGQTTCERLRVHRDNMNYPNHINDADALGCFKYANISNSQPFINGDLVTVFWEVHHTGSNELHFALSEGWATRPTDVAGNTQGFRGALYRTTSEGIGLHTLTYGYPDRGTETSNAIRATGQRFYELLMYPSGRVSIRRVSCNSINVENGGACQRWGGGVSANFPPGFTYNSNDNPHKFWMSFDRGSGRYQMGSGQDAGQNQILDWTDPIPIPVTTISANVYCCDRSGCLNRANDDNGYFCFCTGNDGTWCRGSAPPTTARPSVAPTFSPSFTGAPTTSTPSANPSTSGPTGFPSLSPTVSSPTAAPTLGPTAMHMRAMPAQLAPAQMENVAQMQTMLTYELQTLLRNGGVPASVVNTTYRKADLIRIAILYDINVSTLPPSLASGGGQTGTGASSGDGDKSSTSNMTMITVVIAVTVVVIVVIIAGTVYVKSNRIQEERNFDNPMYNAAYDASMSNDSAGGGGGNGGYMDIQPDGQDGGYMDVPAN